MEGMLLNNVGLGLVDLGRSKKHRKKKLLKKLHKLEEQERKLEAQEGTIRSRLQLKKKRHFLKQREPVLRRKPFPGLRPKPMSKKMYCSPQSLCRPMAGPVEPYLFFIGGGLIGLLFLSFACKCMGKG